MSLPSLNGMIGDNNNNNPNYQLSQENNDPQSNYKPQGNYEPKGFEPPKIDTPQGNNAPKPQISQGKPEKEQEKEPEKLDPAPPVELKNPKFDTPKIVENIPSSIWRISK